MQYNEIQLTEIIKSIYEQLEDRNTLNDMCRVYDVSKSYPIQKRKRLVLERLIINIIGSML